MGHLRRPGLPFVLSTLLDPSVASPVDRPITVLPGGNFVNASSYDECPFLWDAPPAMGAGAGWPGP